jgi:molecular chaperone DnaK (HSP70)
MKLLSWKKNTDITPHKNSDITLTSSLDTGEHLIIAFDFGTTYSGVAYCFPSQQDAKVYPIMDWPEGETAPKIPTLIRYDAHNSSRFSWGPSVNQVNQRENAIVGVKLLLDPSQECPLYLPIGHGTTEQDIRKLQKTPVQVAADFLGAIHQHALSEIARKVPAGYLSLCSKQFVLSGNHHPRSIPRRRA